MKDGISLDELAEQVGIEPRTLRSWVAQDLLAAPKRPGRGALYPAGNVERALAVRALKELHGLSFPEIRQRMLLAGEADIAALAREIRMGEQRLSSARDYLRQVRAGGKAPVRRSLAEFVPPPASAARAAPAEHVPADHADSATGDAGQAGIEALLAALEMVADPSRPRRIQGADWMRIAITPDIELHVRGPLLPLQRDMLERAGDLIRTILTGG